MGGRSCWIIICSPTNSQAMLNLAGVATAMPGHGAKKKAVASFLDSTAASFSEIGARFAGITKEPLPDLSAFGVKQQIAIRADQTAALVRAACEVARYRLDDPEDRLPDSDAETLIELLESTEAEAIRLMLEWAPLIPG